MDGFAGQISRCYSVLPGMDGSEKDRTQVDRETVWYSAAVGAVAPQMSAEIIASPAKMSHTSLAGTASGPRTSQTATEASADCGKKTDLIDRIND